LILAIEIIFWVAVYAMFHTYILYPLGVIIFSKSSKKREPISFNSSFQPHVAVVFAAYNEESVIKEKIDSIYNSEYPATKISVYIGSDASTDTTDIIVKELQSKYSNLCFVRFNNRTGKSGIINQLFEICKEDIVIGTDANIIFNEKTISNFVRHFNDANTSLVGGNISYIQKNKLGISTQENTYLSFENKLKQAESDLWSKVQGVEGGLYCIRKKDFTPIPPLTFMEDFFITCSVLKNKGSVLFDKEALGYEDVSTMQEEEFKRKTRISIGNFQNLRRFKGLLIEQPFPLGFAFLSHKILRWFTPFLALITIISALLLQEHILYLNYLYIVIYLLLLTFLDWLLYQLKISSGPLRYWGHFTMMNLALLNGFFKYIKGVRTNVWQPTKRNQ
jgi:cellulose synthase/poly-beta-1,6-N-acetylglucosamine synthase-like glycosyltransferase